MLGVWSAIEKIGNGIFGLRANCREDHKLERALSRVSRRSDTRGVEFRIIVEGISRPFRSPILREVYRIAREGLVNAFHHSQGSQIEAELHFTTRHFEMFIRDNGRGVNARTLSGRRDEHRGLLCMSKRAERIGAKFRIMSRIDLGTEIQVVLPGGVAFESRHTKAVTKGLPALDSLQRYRLRSTCSDGSEGMRPVRRSTSSNCHPTELKEGLAGEPCSSILRL